MEISSHFEMAILLPYIPQEFLSSKPTKKKRFKGKDLPFLSHRPPIKEIFRAPAPRPPRPPRGPEVGPDSPSTPRELQMMDSVRLMNEKAQKERRAWREQAWKRIVALEKITI